LFTCKVGFALSCVGWQQAFGKAQELDTLIKSRRKRRRRRRRRRRRKPNIVISFHRS